jgi:hypothetical protein
LFDLFSEDDFFPKRRIILAYYNIPEFLSFQKYSAGRCVRKGRFESGTVSVSGLCPAPCHARPDCGSCLDQSGTDCVWCEDTAVCFSFAAYTRSLSLLQCAVLVEKAGHFQEKVKF